MTYLLDRQAVTYPRPWHRMTWPWPKAPHYHIRLAYDRQVRAERRRLA